MKQLLLILAVVALLGCGGKSQSEIVEEAVRASLNRQLLLGQVNRILEGAEEEARQIRGDKDLTEEQRGLNLEKLRVDSKEQIRKLLLPESDLNKTSFDKVTRLYLGHTQFTDAGFAELTKLEKLSAIYLDSTEITDKGLMELAKLNQLKKLHLQDTEITDAGLKEVAKLKQLISLNLYCSEIHSSQITDAGLMEVVTLTNLTMLNLDGQKKITDEGLKELAKLTKLRELYLRRTRISFTAVDELRSALRNCKIHK